jgi:malonate-semialdehyde dehydrogenase (acetylating)/methylmalonate-semialdehyde dehydrogenase
MTHFIHSFINGKVSEGTSENVSEIYNPCTGKVIGLTSFATKNEIDQCIDSAKKAFTHWSNLAPIRRARILFRYNELLDKHKNDIAHLISRENGKTFQDSLGEITRGIEIVEFACGIPQLLKGDFSENVGSEVDTVSLRQPLGIVAGITPFNFPAMVPMWMFPIAIACGNVFVLKPSEKVPSAALLLAELLTQAGCPNGVFSVLQGGKDVVDQLLRSEDISAISFVGSTPIARKIYAEGALNGKRVQALGGAKNHMIVMPDGDVDAAVSSLMGAAYGSAGQRCMAISVAVAVGDETADLLVEKLKSELKTLKIGSPYEKDVEMGPLISAEHREKVRSSIEAGLKEGAELIVDGRNYQTSDGYFIGASLFDHVTAEMEIYKNEIFGPVLCVVRVQKYEEALRLVNEHEFGNGVSIFTESGSTSRHFANHVITGMVGINVPLPVPVAYHSFGGWKSSLFGSHNIYGPEGINFYTRLKAITSRWHKSSGSQFVMPTLD